MATWKSKRFNLASFGLVLLATICRGLASSLKCTESERTDVLVAGDESVINTNTHLDLHRFMFAGGVALQTHEDGLDKSINILETTGFIKHLMKRSTRHGDINKQDVNREEKRRRILLQQYRLFRQRKLKMNKKQPQIYYTTPRIKHEEGQEGTSGANVYNLDKGEKKVPLLGSSVSLPKKYDETLKFPLNTHLRNKNQRKENHKPKVVYRPSVEIKSAVVLDKKNSKPQKVKTINKHINMKKNSNREKFGEYKSKISDRLKRLRERRRQKKLKHKLRNKNKPKAMNVDVQITPPSSKVPVVKDQKPRMIKTTDHSISPSLQNAVTSTTKGRIISEMTREAPFLRTTEKERVLSLMATKTQFLSGTTEKKRQSEMTTKTSFLSGATEKRLQSDTTTPFLSKTTEKRHQSEMTAKTTKERILSEMTTKTPFLTPTQALDYLTSYESLTKPKRWPIRLVLSSEEVTSPSNSAPEEVNHSPISNSVDIDIKVTSGVSNQPTHENRIPGAVFTTEIPLNKKKNKKKRKSNGSKGKRKRKKGKRNNKKRMRKKRFKKKKRHLKTLKHLRTIFNDVTMSATYTTEITNPAMNYYTNNDLVSVSEMTTFTTVNIEDISSQTPIYDSPADFVTDISLSPGEASSPTSIEYDWTNYPFSSSSDKPYSRIHLSTSSARNEKTNTDVATNRSNHSSRINNTINLPECNNSTICFNNETLEHKKSSPTINNSQILSLYNDKQNTSIESLQPELNNLTELSQNSSYSDDFLAGLDNGTTTKQNGTSSSTSITYTGIDAFSNKTESEHIDDITSLVLKPSLENNFTLLIENTSAEIVSTNETSSLTSSPSLISFAASPSSSENDKLPEVIYSSSPTIETISSSSSSSSLLSSSSSSSSQSSSSSSSSSSSPSSLSSSSVTATATISTFPRTKPSSISRWRQWAINRRKRLKNKGNTKSNGDGSKSNRRKGSRKNGKYHGSNTKNYVRGRGSVAGSLVIIDTDKQEPTRLTSQTPSTKSPFIGHKTAYDFLSGQKGVRRPHKSEERRESDELNSVMAENMCEVFDKHFVPTNIGGKCV